MKSAAVIFIMFQFSVIEGHSQSAWFPLNTGTNTYFYSIYFVDNNTGFAGGQNSMIKTTDGGVSWFNIFNNTVSSIQFLNYNTRFAIGVTVIKTTNGGLNWTFGSVPFAPLSISIVDSLVGYGCGYSGTGPLLMKSTDGGNSWFSLNPGIITYPFYTIHFPSRNVGFVGGGYQQEPNTFGIIRRTTDGGISWTTSYSPSNFLIESIFFLNEITGFAAGGRYMLKTVNQGNSWFIFQTPVFTSFYSIHFPNVDTGYAAGGRQETGVGRVWKTENGGSNWLSWFECLNYQNAMFRSAHFPSPAVGYVAGQNGTIMKTTTGGVSYLNPVGGNVPESFRLYQNYPNPFNPETKIRFDIAPNVNSHVKLVIYDILGREVSVLVNEKLAAGTYEVSWLGTDYPSGIYYYKLIGEDYSETRKLVLKGRIFCNGHCFLADGRLLGGGGHRHPVDPPDLWARGMLFSYIFDPVSETWSYQGPSNNPVRMSDGRWYPTLTLLGEPFELRGKVLASGGFRYNYAPVEPPTLVFNDSMEIYTPGLNANWEEINGATNPVIANYPGIHVIPFGSFAGQLLYSMPIHQAYRFNPNEPTSFWNTVGGPRELYRGGECSVLLPLTAGQTNAKIMIIGGLYSEDEPATNTCEIIEMNTTSPNWGYTGSTAYGRRNANAVLLPDGKVLLVGGNQQGLYYQSVRLTKVFNPSTGQWKSLISQNFPRRYHSTAILLPDGRVWSSGGEGEPPQGPSDNLEIYSPGYLFDDNRPQILSGPSQHNLRQYILNLNRCCFGFCGVN